MKATEAETAKKPSHTFEARLPFFCITVCLFEQEDNGMPIHLKGGTKDALLYRTTMALTVFGSAYVVYVLFSAAMPKKPQ